MNKPKRNSSRTQSSRNSSRNKAKQNAVFDAAGNVFAQYGFKRTTMNDIAQAAGISRPALYLMFDNKEMLFHELAEFRLNQGIEEAIKVLTGRGTLKKRFIGALLIFEKIYYEPVMNSPHGDELMDINQSLAADVMMKGIGKLVSALAKELKDAEKAGEASFKSSPHSAKAFVELLLSAIGGVKKKSNTAAEFRKKTEQIASIFLSSIVD